MQGYKTECIARVGDSPEKSGGSGVRGSEAAVGCSVSSANMQADSTGEMEREKL